MSSSSVKPNLNHYISYNIVLTEVLEFIGETPVDVNLVSEAIEFSSFNQMKNRETKKEILNKKDKIDDSESYHLRKGKIGGYAEYLTEEDIEYINNIINKTQNNTLE